ncbi:GNAT family N-acetyltransferase [Heyndrickxia sporothermodurans]
MAYPNVKVTYRVQRIIENTEREAADKVVSPEHIWIACLQERSGALGEIRLRCNLNISYIEDSPSKPEKSPYFNKPVSAEVMQVMEMAEAYMRRYNQIYLNIGHLLKALVATKVLDHYLTEEDKQTILQLGTTARDMITHLGTYTFPTLPTYSIRKVNQSDEQSLVAFVKQHFSEEWSHTVKTGFEAENPSTYLAFNKENEIIGFACFDTYQKKKGYFGPMGVSTANRIGGVGHALLHHCLKDMKDIGYEYAIIGGAGPIEFYEKACQAVIIPSRED